MNTPQREIKTLTREEAIVKYTYRSDGTVDTILMKVINEIFDDLENRVCSDCHYWAKNIHMCNNKKSFVYKFKATVLKGDGCNCFERSTK